MSDEGMPATVGLQMKIVDKLVNGLLKNDVKISNILVDPLVQPLSVNTNFGKEFLDTVEKIMKQYEGIHTACGLPNISYVLPARKFLHQTFMIMAIAKGLDDAIVNLLDKKMMANIIAAESMMGRNEFCTNYLKAYRSKQLEM